MIRSDVASVSRCTRLSCHGCRRLSSPFVCGLLRIDEYMHVQQQDAKMYEVTTPVYTWDKSGVIYRTQVSPRLLLKLIEQNVLMYLD